MNLEQKIREAIERFRSAVYGEEVRESYAQIAELVCVEAMQALDHAVDQGDYAEKQGDYAKTQGDYAKTKGDYAGEQTDLALSGINFTMLQITNEFENMKETLEATENGTLLLEVNKLLKDLYRMAEDDDIDNIIAGTYVDEDNEGSIFETGTNQDIDDIIGGTYTDYGEA